MSEDKILIEVSWEIANKVGGIYTVIKEKADYILKYFRNYYVIGPYLPNRSSLEFSSLNPSDDILYVINECKKLGFDVYYGEWLIGARPKCFLIDFKIFLNNINSLKYELWANYRIDSLRTGDDYNYPLAWSKAVSIFLKIFGERFNAVPKILHLHEWLSGAVILFHKLPFITIFTTHATVLGRTLTSAGVNLWEILNNIDIDKEALKYSVEAKHSIEKIVSQKVDFFTTVSEVLSAETGIILGKKADYLLPNGINLTKFLTVEEITYAHKRNKEILLNFFLYFFSPYYRLETKKSLIYFISGRPEIRNKGIDIFIRSLSLLNKKLSDENPNILVLLLIPNEHHGINSAVMNNFNVYRDLEEKLDEALPEIKSRLIHFLIHKERIISEGFFDKNEFLEMQKLLKRLITEATYPISPFNLKPDDEILKILNIVGLRNLPEDKVKIIYYPSYLRRGDGLLNLDYDEAVSGCHLGIFPSLYEPWGYTPLETAASGVITITTDLTGFADFVKKNVSLNHNAPGVYIIKRKNRRDSDVVEDLANLMLGIAKLNKSLRVENKLEARRIASYCSWEKLINYYLELYNIALKKNYL